MLSRRPGFALSWVWYVSAVAVILQMTLNLLLLRREFNLKFAPQLATDQPSLSA